MAELIKRWWVTRHVDAAVAGGAPHCAYAVQLGVDPDRVWDRYDVVDNDYFSSRADALRAEGSRARVAGLPKTIFCM